MLTLGYDLPLPFADINLFETSVVRAVYVITHSRLHKLRAPLKYRALGTCLYCAYIVVRYCALS